MGLLTCRPWLSGPRRERQRGRPSLDVALIALLASLSGAASPTPAWAQYSPNCLKDGRKAFCALTMAAEPKAETSVITVVFADHSAYRLTRDLPSCRSSGAITRCRATISAANGQQPAQAATYMGTWYEGGYRHDYRSGQVGITFFFLD